MRVLWYTPTSSQYEKGSHHYHGGGWIESLEQQFTLQTNIDLGIVFFHHTDSQKKQAGKITYYPIPLKKRNNAAKLVHNWQCKTDSGVYTKKFLEAIEDFKPDVIQIFGTEGLFPEIQNHTSIPIIIHLQGLINPYNNSFYPPGINGYTIFFHAPFLKNHVLGNSLLFDKKRFDGQAARELGYFKKTRHLTGRTEWDRTVSSILAPQASYYHIDEILRPAFYEEEAWVPKTTGQIEIASTISPTIYKGLDVVLKTAAILKDKLGNDSFKWHVFGLNNDNKLIRFFEAALKKNFKENNVIFEGIHPEHILIASLKKASVFVHPSYIDNSPNSLCEAQMLGIPVIACNAGGTSTLIQHNITGLLVPANAPFELANSIIELAEAPATSGEMGRRARALAIERHDRSKIITELKNLYLALSKNK